MVPAPVLRGMVLLEHWNTGTVYNVLSSYNPGPSPSYCPMPVTGCKWPVVSGEGGRGTDFDISCWHVAGQETPCKHWELPVTLIFCVP